MSIRVRPLAAADQAAWRRLWEAYCAFYEAGVPQAVTEATWHRLLADDSPMFGLVAEVDGTVAGIANAVLHLNTWSDRSVCYLEDLFVDPNARGGGIGRALIEALAARAREEGWYRLYWMTHRHNETARALYEKLTPATDWVRYDLPL